MNFLNRLLGGGKKGKPESSTSTLRGAEPVQTKDEADAARKNMEDEMQADRARRQAKADEAASTDRD
jgi:hypothetical protein